MDQASQPESPSTGALRWLPNAVFIFPLFFLVWALWAYPAVLHKTPQTLYALTVSWISLIKLGLVFYGLFLVPGLWMFFQIEPGPGSFSFLTARRILLAFALGCTAHGFAIFFQKYLHLPYRPWWVLTSLAVAYLALFFLLKLVPAKELLQEEGRESPQGWETGMVWGILLLTLFLGLEMTLRGRASTVSLTGDGYPHFINLLGTLEDGPLPDQLPFYSTFVLNIHPMAFHALLADLKTLTPGILHIDLFRYFSVLMVPLFVACMMGFFTFLSQNRLAAALATAAALFVSGGGLSLRIPIVYFPWYWSIAWCLVAAVFTILLKGNFESKRLCFWAGLVFGIGVLMHPFFAFRMGTIMGFFLPIEILRRLLVRQPLFPILPASCFFCLGVFLPLGAWLIPLLLKHPWEETYSYPFILEHFRLVAPKGVAYIQKFGEEKYTLRDLWQWSKQNVGLLPLVTFPLGIYAIFHNLRKSSSSLLLAWMAAMVAAILGAYLPNPYRYFEYFFFATVAVSAYGMGFLLNALKDPWKALLGAALLCVAFFSIRGDFLTKYSLALKLYGRESLTDTDVAGAESRAFRYLESKRAGRLDLEYGSYTGYLWSRQKKIWDIYIKTQTPPSP